MGQHYKEISAIALQRRQDAIPQEYLLPQSALVDLPLNLTGVPRSSGHFTMAELEIIESPANIILDKLKRREWTAVQVTGAFSKSACVAQQLTNCLTEILFPSALARAAALDAHLSSTGQVVGPLHGLPISLKDSFIVPPHPSSIGMARYANEPTKHEEKTSLVGVLEDLGAILFVKTNVPVAMMMMETINNVWGETTGAWHSGTSPGGSSGGEGALLAMRGSPLGVGTDIGGSIRIPSAFNGLYGLKPTFGRFPQYGGKSGIPGQDYIYANNGPMARSLETLKLYCAAVLSDEVSPWNLDPKCIPLPWRGDAIVPKGRKLRFGIVLDNDGEITVHPPISRGLALTRKALEAAGHEVFEWEPKDHPQITASMNGAFHRLGGGAIVELTRAHEEPLFGSMGPYEAAYIKGEAGSLGPTKLREMIVERNAFQKMYLDRWSATKTSEKPAMDGIIIATSPWTAARLGVTQTDVFCVNYTGVFNVLDYPACTFPVTFADKILDPARTFWKPLNEKDAALQSDYDPEFYHGTPVSLQCVGRRMEDEKVLEMTGVISDALRKYSLKAEDEG